MEVFALLALGCEEPCVSKELCWLTRSLPDGGASDGSCPFEPEEVFHTSFSNYELEQAQCIMEAFRDRTPGVARYGYNCGAASREITVYIAGEYVGIAEYRIGYYEHSQSETEESDGELKPASFYEDCLNGPSDELHECFAELFDKGSRVCPPTVRAINL